MANRDSRAKLARAAVRLNAASRHAGLVPPLILLTDDARLDDPLAAARALPRGSAVIIRAKDAGRRRVLAEALMALAPARALHILVAADPALAQHCRADGVHWPQARLGEALHWRARRPDWFVTAAVHDVRSLLKARTCRVNAVLVSPVFATASHPGAPALGRLRAAAIARAGRLPAYALGGIDAGNASALCALGWCGIGAIGGLMP